MKVLVKNRVVFTTEFDAICGSLGDRWGFTVLQFCRPVHSRRRSITDFMVWLY